MVHWAETLDFQLLGPIPRVAVSDRLFRRIANDPDAHHSCYSDQQDSFSAEPRELAADRHNAIHHGVRDVAAELSSRPGAGTHAPSVAVLADPVADTAGLCGPYANDKGLAAAEEMDLDAALRCTRGESYLCDRRLADPEPGTTCRASRSAY
jgi:hypothetical protein